MQKCLKNKEYLLWLYAIVMVSVFLLPGFSVPGLWFKLRPEDILLPFVLLANILTMNRFWHFYFFIPIAYVLLIIISIIVNGRMGMLPDYFEVYKVLKFVVYSLFFYFLMYSFSFYAVLRWVFAILFIFNVFHYFDILNFNEFVLPLYSQGPHLEFFGLNSLGEPDTIRLLGTMGNPNVNAIVMLFFFALFLVKEKRTAIENLIFYTSFVLLISCQSRTGFIAAGILYAAYLIFWRPFWRKTLPQLSVFIVLFLLVTSIDIFSLSYLNSLSSPAVVQTNSVQGRFEIWQHLWEMIKQKPVFGHGPFKEYFYENGIYPESEYVLVLWRYGFVGFFVFLCMLFFPAAYVITRIPEKRASVLVLLSIVFSITSITNNPFSEPRIMILIAFMIGLWLAMTKEMDTFVRH